MGTGRDGATLTAASTANSAARSQQMIKKSISEIANKMAAIDVAVL